MKIILWLLMVILFIFSLQLNVLTNPQQVKDSVNFYQNTHIIYLVFFLLISVIIYLKINLRQPIPQFPKNKASLKPGVRKKENPGFKMEQLNFNRVMLCLTGILGAGFLLRTIIAVTFPGYPYDIQAFIHWSAAAARDLPGIYFDPNIPPRFTLTYPPVYLYVLGIIGKLIKFFLVDSSSILLIMLKLPAIIADIATGYLLYRFSKKYLSQSWCLFIVWLYVFNPVTIFNSALWGQVDSFLTLFIMIGLMLIDAGRLPWATAFFVLAILTKPQGVFALPVLFWELFRRKKVRDFLWAALAGLVTFAIVIMPFSLARGPFWIVQQYIKTAQQFPFATVNAYNIYALFGANLKYDSTNFLLFNYYTWGFIFILGLLGLGTYLYWNNLKRENPRNGLSFLTALLLSVGIFVLATRMHERYLFAALTIALLVYVRFPDRRVLYLFAGLTVTNYLNIAQICFEAFHQNVYGPDWIVPVVSLANVLLLVYLIKIAIGFTKDRTLTGNRNSVGAVSR